MSQANWTHRCGYSGLASVPPCVRESATSIVLSKWKWEQSVSVRNWRQNVTFCESMLSHAPSHVTTQHEESLVESFMASGYYESISKTPLSNGFQNIIKLFSKNFAQKGNQRPTLLILTILFRI